MKILFVTEFFPSDNYLRFTGGVEARTYYTAKLLAATDKIMVICRRIPGLKQKLSIGNLTIYPCGPTQVTIEASFLSIWERIVFMAAATWQGLKLNFDLVEGSNFITYLPAYVIGLIKHRPKIAWFADVLANDWFKYFGLAGFFGNLMENISLDLSWSGVIALSQNTANKLINRGVKRDITTVIYGGVNFSKSKIEKDKSKSIICISRLVKYKKIDNLLLAFHQLKNKFPNLRLIIVGQGPEKNRLKQLVIRLSLSKKVIFLANLKRDELIKLLCQCTIFCLPSIIEGFGLVTIEAAACLTPFVVSNVPINKEITHNGLGGLLFKPENIEDLADKLTTLLVDKNIYDQKRKEVAKLRQFYNWSKIIGQTRKFYRGMTNV